MADQSTSAPGIRPIWKLLLEVANGDKASLDCNECLSILEYLADFGSIFNLDQQALTQVAQRHLACCPDCMALYQERLSQLELRQQSETAEQHP